MSQQVRQPCGGSRLGGFKDQQGGHRAEVDRARRRVGRWWDHIRKDLLTLKATLAVNPPER